MTPDAEKALQLAEHDLVMAEVGLERGFFEQCVYHCHQALEKLLKALWSAREGGGAPPRTHNLAGLALELFPDLSEADLQPLQRLSQQYLPARYVEYDTAYSEEEVIYYYQRTTELFSWLRQQLS